jgi:hypothetical protein
MRNFILFCFSAGLLLTGSAARAQTNTWTGATSTDWHSGCNWSLGIVPTCLHNVVIPSSTTNKPTITGVASCLTIDIQGVASTLLTLANGSLLQVDLCPTANTVNASGKIVFVSTSGYDSDVSVATRDAACNSNASTAGLSGTYKAWIYNPSTGANNVPSTGGSCGYVRPDGTQIATSWADLTDGNLSNGGITMYANQGSASGAEVFTGLSSNGTSSGSNCSGWSDWSAQGTYGIAGNTTAGWWTARGTDDCGSQTQNFNCNAPNDVKFIGIHPSDDCQTCWGIDETSAVCVAFGGCNNKSQNSGAACGAYFSTAPRCCVLTGTTTNYASKRHYCFQQ